MNTRSRFGYTLRACLPGGRLFYLPVFVVANLPTVAVLLAHEKEKLLEVMLPYPGQFLFLGPFFLFAAYYTAKTGQDLEGLWAREAIGGDIHVSKFYPSWAKPGYGRIVLATLLGIALALISFLTEPLPRYSKGTGYDFLIRILDLAELATVIVCAFFLFLWCAIIGLIRLDMRHRNQSPEILPPVVRSSAMHGGAALIMFSFYAPLRAYTIHEFPEPKTLEVIPYIVLILFFVAGLPILFCFLSGRTVAALLKFLLGTPFVLAFLGVAYKGKFLRRYLDTECPDIGNLLVMVVVGISAFLILYTVLRGIVDPESRNAKP